MTVNHCQSQKEQQQQQQQGHTCSNAATLVQLLTGEWPTGSGLSAAPLVTSRRLNRWGGVGRDALGISQIPIKKQQQGNSRPSQQHCGRRESKNQNTAYSCWTKPISWSTQVDCYTSAVLSTLHGNCVVAPISQLKSEPLTVEQDEDTARWVKGI